MQILLRSTKIIDPKSKHNGKVLDVLINDGKIESIGKDIDSTLVNEVIEGDDLHVSAGWVDLYATIGDPGNEHNEEIETGLNAAAQGGFTKIAISPEANPAADDKSAIKYILNKAANHVVDALPIGATTNGLRGEELAEMFDMKQAGAVAISNGKHTISNAKLQHLALQYVKNLELPIFSYCDDAKMSAGGQMHEGAVNTSLGLKGIPALAEELAIARDIYLAEYSDVAIHFSHVTTKGSVELIRQAKSKGLKVTASVPAHHLLLTDENIKDFDSNYKVLPPFRDAEHIEALKAGLADGTIDAIISDHEPHEIEAKFSEFGIAEPGIIALETAFSSALKALNGKLSIEQVIEKLTIGPRKILQMNQPKIEEGELAELTVFAPSIGWKYEKSSIKSRSANSPLIGSELPGLPVAIINNGKLHVNS
jgi:dihydroorotase